jgi:hypothetical protein
LEFEVFTITQDPVLEEASDILKELIASVFRISTLKMELTRDDFEETLCVHLHVFITNIVFIWDCWVYLDFYHRPVL